MLNLLRFAPQVSLLPPMLALLCGCPPQKANERAYGPIRVTSQEVGNGFLHLKSADPDFGGISGLVVTGNHLVAITDRGNWLTARLLLDSQGEMTGLTDWRIAPLLGVHGEILRGANTDAESLTRDRRGGYLVSFEQRHRVWRYEKIGARAEAVKIPAVDMPSNGGFEAITVLADGRLLLFCEDDDRIWLDGKQLRYPVSDDFKPTDVDVWGDKIIVLERRFSLFRGLAVRLRAMSLEDLAPKEILRFKTPIDNFEGLSIDGGYLHVISDNNFRPQQRTLFKRDRIPPLNTLK